MTLPLPPHGGANAPIENLIPADQVEASRLAAAKLPPIVVSDADLSTVRRLGDGALTPLTGFMTSAVYNRVLKDETIDVDGTAYAWGIPLALPITVDERGEIAIGKSARLLDQRGHVVAILDVEDVWDWDKDAYNTAVYGTERTDHPGARIALDDPREVLVGGRIHVFPWKRDTNDVVQKYAFSPAETRAKLAASGWEAAVAFQTRNPLHRAHEYAMVAGCERLTAQGLKAGVVLNPLVGETKSDDVPAATRMLTYEKLKSDRLLGQGDSDPEIWKKAGRDINDVFDLFALDIKMFYGGPREALMHAIYRQNYGFSHIVIGRKHADAPYDDGTNIWGDFDAQEKFKNLKGKLEIKPVNIGFAAYFEELGHVGLIEEHAPKGWKPVTVAGRILREMLQKGETPDPRIIRPETSAILIKAYADRAAKERNITWHHHSVSRQDRESLNKHRGATLWFTGLSGSGKSTLANELAGYLHEHGIRTYVLDGDNVRHGLNKDLGFSPDDRKENIRRIGEVAKLFTDSGVVNMTAFISPYREDRQIARDLQQGEDEFIEIYVEADLAVCEERDPKGLYKKARAGEIPQFTGISAPYEAPEDAEITVNTGTQSIVECIETIAQELTRRGVIRIG